MNLLSTAFTDEPPMLSLYMHVKVVSLNTIKLLGMVSREESILCFMEVASSFDSKGSKFTNEAQMHTT